MPILSLFISATIRLQTDRARNLLRAAAVRVRGPNGALLGRFKMHDQRGRTQEPGHWYSVAVRMSVIFTTSSLLIRQRRGCRGKRTAPREVDPAVVRHRHSRAPALNNSGLARIHVHSRAPVSSPGYPDQIDDICSSTWRMSAEISATFTVASDSRIDGTLSFLCIVLSAHSGGRPSSFPIDGSLSVTYGDGNTPL